MARTKKDFESVEVLSYAEQVEEMFLDLYTKYDIASSPEKRKSEIIDSLWGEIYDHVFKPDSPTFNNCKSKLLVYDVENIQEVVETYIRLCKRYGGVIKYNQFSKLTGFHRDTLYNWHKYNTTGKYIYVLNDSQYQEDSSVLMFINTDNGVVEYHSSDVFNSTLSNTNINVVYDNGNVRENINNIYNNIKANSRQDRHLLSKIRFDVVKRLQEEMQDSNTNQLSNDTMGAVVRANNEPELGKLYEPKRLIQREQIRQALPVSELPKLVQNAQNSLNFNQGENLIDIDIFNVDGSKP